MNTKFHQWLDRHETTKFLSLMVLFIIANIFGALELYPIFLVFAVILLGLGISRIVYLNRKQ